MKKFVLFITFTIILSFSSFPQQLQYLDKFDSNISSSTEASDDDSFTKTEHISINYARKDKRIKIEKYEKVIERSTAAKATHFYIMEFNCTGLFTEAIKRDYTGDDWITIA